MPYRNYIIPLVFALVFIFVASIAVATPHGEYTLIEDEPTASTKPMNSPKNTSAPKDSFAGRQEKIVFISPEGIEVNLPLEGMPVFKSETVETDEGTFTGVGFSSLLAWSGLSAKSDLIVVKDAEGKGHMCRVADLVKKGNAFIVYADENGSPLDASKYGAFMFFIKEGDSAGLIQNVTSIDFG